MSPPSAASEPRNMLAVVLWMAGALLSFSATAVSVRGLAGSLGTFEILELRSASAIVILVLAGLLRPALFRGFSAQRLPLHLLRNSVHFGSTYLWTLSLTLLPLATAFALEFTTPLWVTVMAVPFLGERLTRSRVLAALLGFLGVLVILRPGSGTLQPASFFMLLAAVGFALTSIATKSLTGRVSTFSILLWMNLMQLPMNIAGALATGGSVAVWRRLDMHHLPATLGIMTCGLASHLCLTSAMRRGDAMVVQPLDFLRIPLIALVGWWLYAERLDLMVLAGAGLIIVGIVQNLHAESRGRRTLATGEATA